METCLPRAFSISLNGSKIDPSTSTIRQVSLISMGEARGHDCYVDQTTLQQVFDCLTEMTTLKVKSDHGSGVLSTIGYVDSFCLGNGKVIGDLHIYDSEPERPRIFEIAQKNPTHFGMSLEFEGIDQLSNGKKFARCSDVSAVALVSDPAANKSLFGKSTKIVDLNGTSDNSSPMATKKLDDKPEPKPEDKKDLDATPAPTEANDFTKCMEAIQKIGERMDKYDNGAVNKEDDAKPALPAINPNVEPKADNNGPTPGNGEAGSVKGEEPGANPPGAWEEDEKKLSAIVDTAVSKALRNFGARLGIPALPSRNAPLVEDKSTAKTFQQLVDDKTKEFEKAGDKKAPQSAMLFCLTNHKKEYAESRLVRTL